jgi:hypothetical protein
MNDKRKEEVFDGTPSHYLAVISQPVNVYLNFKQLSRDDGTTPLSAGEAKKLLAVRTRCIGLYAAAKFSGLREGVYALVPLWSRVRSPGSRVQGPESRVEG